MTFVFTIVSGADGAAAASAHASPYPEWNALLASRLSATVLRSHDSCSVVAVPAAVVLVAVVVHNRCSLIAIALVIAAASRASRRRSHWI